MRSRLRYRKRVQARALKNGRTPATTTCSGRARQRKPERMGCCRVGCLRSCADSLSVTISRMRTAKFLAHSACASRAPPVANRILGSRLKLRELAATLQPHQAPGLAHSARGDVRPPARYVKPLVMTHLEGERSREPKVQRDARNGAYQHTNSRRTGRPQTPYAHTPQTKGPGLPPARLTVARAVHPRRARIAARVIP